MWTKEAIEKRRVARKIRDDHMIAMFVGEAQRNPYIVAERFKVKPELVRRVLKKNGFRDYNDF